MNAAFYLSQTWNPSLWNLGIEWKHQVLPGKMHKGVWVSWVWIFVFFRICWFWLASYGLIPEIVLFYTVSQVARLGINTQKCKWPCSHELMSILALMWLSTLQYAAWPKSEKQSEFVSILKEPSLLNRFRYHSQKCNPLQKFNPLQEMSGQLSSPKDF